MTVPTRSNLAYKQMPTGIWTDALQLLGWLSWLVCLAMIFKLFLIAGEMLFDRWSGHSDSDGGAGVIRVVVACVLVGASAGIAGALLASP